MTSRWLWRNSLSSPVSTKTMPLSTRIWTSPRSHLSGCPDCSTRRWRRREWALARRLWWPFIQGSLTTLANILTADKPAEDEEGAGQPNLPPGETSTKGVWESSQRRTSPRHFDGGMSAARMCCNCHGLYIYIYIYLRKCKNTKMP
jgi:hypothetical protein